MERSSSPQLRKSEKNVSADTTTDIVNAVEEHVCKDRRKSNSNENSQSRVTERSSTTTSEGRDTYFPPGTLRTPPFILFPDAYRKPFDKYYSTLQTPGPSNAAQPNGSVKKSDHTKALNNDTNKVKPNLDADRVNELDCFGNQNHYYHFPSTRTFTNHLLKPHSDVFKKGQKETKEPVAGPSNKGKKTKLSVTNSDDSAFDEAKSITNCILENSLNQVNSNQDIKFIEDHLSINVQNEEPEKKTSESAVSKYNALDSERNETIIHSAQGSLTVIEQNNTNTDMTVAVRLGNEIANENDDEIICEQEEVARSSREALFDPNSQIDLLEDYDLLAPLIPEFLPTVEPALNPRHNILLIGVNMNINEEDQDNANIHHEDESTQDSDDDGFPDWLLQIMLGGHAENEDEESHDEPHFYCQGDGLGVHPSVIAVDVDDEDGATTDSSSSNSTQEFAEAESHNDGTSLGDEELVENRESTVAENAGETQHQDEEVWGAVSQDEYFDTFEGE